MNFDCVLQLSGLSATDLDGCSALAELRLGHNELTSLPLELGACTRLKILDLGANRIRSLEDIKVGILVSGTGSSDVSFSSEARWCFYGCVRGNLARQARSEQLFR